MKAYTALEMRRKQEKTTLFNTAWGTGINVACQKESALSMQPWPAARKSGRFSPFNVMDVSVSARAWYVGVARAETDETKFTLTRESFSPKTLHSCRC